ncbi:MAG: o-succinylbenzoate synthase [Acidimicrobiales bacterium]
MKLEVVELRKLAMPLVSAFGGALGTETVRQLLVVHVSGPDSEGWGECSAMSSPTYSPEYVDGALAVIRDHLVPRLAALAPEPTAEQVAPVLAPVKGHLMAKASLEMALLDAQLRAKGQSLASYFGTARTSVPSGVAVGTTASVAELLDVVAGYQDQGYKRVKLKIMPGWDLEPVSAVREHFPALALQVDANGAYSLADATHLAKLDHFELSLIEQPLPEDDLAGHAALARQLKTPICLDEPITSARAAADAIARGACRVVNIKAGRMGGYLEARRAHDTCAALNVPVWCGGMLESGLARAANVALAGLPNFTLPGDISASDRYWHQDLTEPFVLQPGGRLAVPTEPGLGVEPLPDVLAQCTTSVTYLRWGR